jgi:bifunctional oligoribonuclease and PAP phosphatase NrnA
MENNLSKEILKKINSSNRILIPLHKGPDGDSVGCCMAMKYWLERDFNKKIKVISKDQLGGSLTCFKFVSEIEFGKGVEEINLKDFDLILFLDHGAQNYGSSDSNIPLPKNSVINIDHHETNTNFGDINYVDAKRPSCCSILLDLFREWKVKFDKELSTRLLIGIYTDSGEFSHDKGDALRDAVFLLDNKADYLDGIVNVIKYNTPLGMKRYHALLINNFKVVNFEGYKVGVSLTSKEEVNKLGINLSEVRSGPNYLQEIGGIDFLFTLAEVDDFIKGSFRSRKKIDTSLFAKELGGGGHKFAAAFKFPKIPLKLAEKKVFEAIKKVGIHEVE